MSVLKVMYLPRMVVHVVLSTYELSRAHLCQVMVYVVFVIGKMGVFLGV